MAHDHAGLNATFWQQFTIGTGMWAKAKALEGHEDLVRNLVERQDYTHKDVSRYLQSACPGVAGLSAVSVNRFCRERNIHRYVGRTADSGSLDQVICQAVCQVGPYYGRNTMKGYLHAKYGLRVGDKRVASSLERVSPLYVAARRSNAAQRANPVPYFAEYSGHRVHFDQNEKLVQYGITHVAARDGYSGGVVGVTTMPLKNCVKIYDKLYRPMVEEYGIWDQLRVDHGREFALICAVQNHLSPYRHNTARTAVRQTTSTRNHVIERWWVEANQRVNYPLKECLNELVETEEIDMEDAHHRYFVSWFGCNVASAGLRSCAEAWNAHHIPRKGIPNVLMESNHQAVRLNPDLLPTTDEAVNLFTEDGGRLTLPADSSFGQDPLANAPQLQAQRLHLFSSAVPRPEIVHGRLVNGHRDAFIDGLRTFADISFRFADNL